MFTIARYFIKTSFIFFIIGILSGLYLYTGNIFHLSVPDTLISAHAHIIFVGGMLMMIIGVAIWFFPRPLKDDIKYDPKKILFLYWALTLSTFLRFVLELFYGNGINGDEIILIGAYTCTIAQVLSIILLIYSIWDRIRPIGSQIREKKGEKF